MEKNQQKAVSKIAAYSFIIGSVCMLSGAATLVITGSDLDLALYANDMAGFLKTANENQVACIFNISIWIVGVTILGIGGNMTSLLSKNKEILPTLIRYNYAVGVPLVIASYMAWLAVIVVLGPSTSPEASAIAQALGWFGTRADWISTVFVIGTGPLLICQAGRGVWVPNWLRIWSYLAFFTGILTTIAQFTGGLGSYGFIIIPVGMGWVIAASIVLFKTKLEG